MIRCILSAGSLTLLLVFTMIMQQMSSIHLLAMERFMNPLKHNLFLYCLLSLFPLRAPWQWRVCWSTTKNTSEGQRMSKNAALSLVLIFLVLIVTGAFCVGPAKAQFGSIQHLPQITINKDGSISPQTAYINQTGNVYALMADINSTYFVKIECSNVIFDGMGYSINTTVNGLRFVDGYPASYADPSIYVRDATNVTIQNVSAVTSNVYAIYLLDCSDCHIIGITTDKSECISIKGNSNIITRCNSGVCV